VTSGRPADLYELQQVQGRNMNNVAASLLSICSVFCCMPRSAHAQSNSCNPGSVQAPILSMDTEFRHVSQYFMQRIEGDPRYSKIEALVDPDRYEVILSNKTANSREFYTNSRQRVAVLQAHRLNAYLAPAKTENFVTIDGFSATHIRLIDNHSKLIGNSSLIKSFPTPIPESSQIPMNAGFSGFMSRAEQPLPPGPS
jgi:hypothetical protein